VHYLCRSLGEKQMNQQAFVLRIAPGGIDKVPEALTTNQIIIGWAEAEGLLDTNLTWEQFREIIRKGRRGT
jgi:hypothetical protein